MLDQEQREKLVEVAESFSDAPASETISIDATHGGEVREIEVIPDVKEELPKKEEEPVEASPEEVSQKETDNSPPSDTKGHNVPYTRFKNVLDARNNFRSEADQYKTQVSSLEEKLQALQSQARTPAQTPQVEAKRSWLDEYLDDDVQETAPEWQNQYSSLNDRLYKFEVAQEEKNLRAELTTLSETFPTVPEDYLLQAVINDPSVNLASKAEEYHSFVSGIGENAIAQYLENNPHGAANVPQVPNRPRSHGSSPAREHITPVKKPSSIGDATNALRDALSKRNPFKD